MKLRALLRWQFDGYGKFHQTRANLLLHIAVVPAFLVGNVCLVYASFKLTWITGVVGIVLTLLSLVLQGRGHAMEPLPPESFTGAANAIVRILLEQWITFPRFVLSGRWVEALRLSRSSSTRFSSQDSRVS